MGEFATIRDQDLSCRANADDRRKFECLAAARTCMPPSCSCQYLQASRPTPNFSLGPVALAPARSLLRYTQLSCCTRRMSLMIERGYWTFGLRAAQTGRQYTPVEVT